MVDSLRSEIYPPEVILNEDGTVKNGFGCLMVSINRCRLGEHVVSGMYPFIVSYLFIHIVDEYLVRSLFSTKQIFLLFVSSTTSLS